MITSRNIIVNIGVQSQSSQSLNTLKWHRRWTNQKGPTLPVMGFKAQLFKVRTALLSQRYTIKGWLVHGLQLFDLFDVKI